MKWTARRPALALGGLALKSGVVRTGSGRGLYDRAYEAHKSWLEAPAIRDLGALITPGGRVFDVGYLFTHA